jgi:hypothetical protein
MMMQLTIRTFPSADRAFAEHVRSVGADTIEPDVLEAALRARYPAVRVHERSELAGFGSSDRTWYVYRDGSLVGDDERVDQPLVVALETESTA